MFAKDWALKKPSVSPERKTDKTAQDELYEALTCDDMPEGQTLAEHDRIKHPDGFNPETDTCKFRERLAKEQKADNADLVDINRKASSNDSKEKEAGGSFVTPEEDAAYMEAANKGDEETCKVLVREAAAKAFPNTKVVDEDGKPKVVYHGGNFGGKGNTIPDLGPGEMHFGTEKAAKERVAYKYQGMEEAASIKPYFLNLENPKRMEDIGGDPIWLDAGNPEDRKHDGVVYLNESEDKGNDSYAVSWDPARIKSAAPIEYDDDGNIIPLSQRFNTDNPDIRYEKNGKAMSSWNEEEKKYLEDTAKKVERFIPGVKVRIAESPYDSPNEDERKSVRERDNTAWNDAVLDVKMGVKPYRLFKIFSSTPSIINKLGARKLPIYIRGKDIQKILGIIPTDGQTWHYMHYKDAQKVQLEMDNPIAVLTSTHDDSLVILTRLIGADIQKDKDGNIISIKKGPAIVALRLECEEKNTKARYHLVVSAYGKELKTLKDWAADGRIKYINKKARDAYAPWLQLPKDKSLRADLLTEKDFSKEKLGDIIADDGTVVKGWEEEKKENPDVGQFLDDEGDIVGTYNRKLNEVTLYPGANADTIAHELCGHATWQYAEQLAEKGNDILLKKMQEVVDSKIAEPVWKEVLGNYGGESHEVQREEVWAHIIGHKGSAAIEEIRKERKGRRWYQRAWDVAKESWKGLMSKIGLNRIVTKDVDKMSPEEFADYMVKQMTSGKTLGKLDNSGGDGGERKSISKIYTGSAANYDKPSLHAVGTGEGSQVYGWGLYGSNQKGVAETYMTGHKHYFKDGKEIEDPREYELALRLDSFSEYGEDIAKNHIKEYYEAIVENGPASKKEFARWALKELEKHQYETKELGKNLYEQTFFTDRAPGDESHLLKWYEPVTEEQLEWIEARLRKELGEDSVKEFHKELAEYEPKNQSQAIYHALSYMLSQNKSADVWDRIKSGNQAASEFLARAGIDGMKYPVDSYGGKGVKDGNEAGWNYVSFRDNNIRIEKKYVDGEKVYDYQELMAKANPNIDPMEVLARITKLGSREEMAAEFKRIMEEGKKGE